MWPRCTVQQKDKSLEFLTHALAEVGFSPAHARRACLATNLAGVPQVRSFVLRTYSSPLRVPLPREAGEDARTRPWCAGAKGCADAPTSALCHGVLQLALGRSYGRVVACVGSREGRELKGNRVWGDGMWCGTGVLMTGRSADMLMALMAGHRVGPRPPGRGRVARFLVSALLRVS